MTRPLCLAPVLLCVNCLVFTTLRPICDDTTAVADSCLAGVWKSTYGIYDTTLVCTIRQADSHSYNLDLVFTKVPDTAHFHLRLTKIRGETFADLENIPGNATAASLFTTPTHTIFMLSRQGDDLMFWMPDKSKLSSDDDMRLGCVPVDGECVYAACTQDLRDAIADAMYVDEFMMPFSVMTRVTEESE